MTYNPLISPIGQIDNHFVSNSRHPGGCNDKRQDLRQQGAAAEAVKAGAEKPAQAAREVDVKTKGGDQGLKMKETS